MVTLLKFMILCIAFPIMGLAIGGCAWSMLPMSVAPLSLAAFLYYVAAGTLFSIFVYFIV
jgi:hypothetical protein